MKTFKTTLLTTLASSLMLVMPAAKGQTSPGEIAVLDSIAPNNDTNMPFGDVIVGRTRTEHITVTNIDSTYGLVVSNISFGAYVENFDDGLAQDWVEITDPYWSVVAGEYRAQAGTTAVRMQSVYTGKRWQDSAAQVVMRRTGDESSAARIVLRATDDFSVPSSIGSAYSFAISGTGGYYVGKYVSGTFSMIQTWTASPYLNIGTATNTVLASIQGSSIRVYFNGSLAWSGSDTSITGEGRVGLLAYSGSGPETVHYFDNITVTDPVSGLVAVSPQQEYYNAHPLTGGSAEMTPPNPPPVPALDPRAEDSNIRILSVVSGPWRLENVPTLPHTVPPGGTLTFDVGYQPTALASNYAKVVIENNDADEPRVEVQLTGQGILDYLQVTPASNFAAQGHPGGPFSPSSTSYVLSNAGPVSINWATTHTQTWVNVSPASGTLAAGESASVAVGFTVAANSLPQGTHFDVVTFSNVTTTVSQQRNVTLTVFTSPEIVVTPVSIAVTNVLGGSTNVTLTVSNAATADGNLSFSISTRETGRSLLQLAGAGVGLPPANRDFTQAAPGKEFTADRLLVRFAAGVQGAQRAQTLNALGGAQIMREYKVVPGLCLVKLPAGQTVAQALPTCNRAAGVLYAEPDYQVKAIATLPNDARFSELWGMHNTGQTGGTPGADIDAPEAWDRNTGSRQVVVAVIDTGVDYTHPDLTNNIWTNPGEIPGNGIDDDDNGYVDDVHGYDFVNNDGDPMDDFDPIYHGTHVSGTIGAEGNNGIGVAGVCWQVRIMGVKFLDAGGGGYTADAISAIEYATLMGARVMNNSWGGGGYEQSLKDAIDAAGAANIVFAAAAGNDYGNDNDTYPVYPASYDSTNIIAVMATDHNDLMSVFSNYGLTNVDLAAPGSSILSCQPGGLYQKLSGTSMATPHVAGACALLLSANPLLDVASLKQALLSTVDTNLPGLCVSGGRLNLARALASAGATWITLTPAGGTNVVPGAAVNVTVGFQAGTLPAGTYTGQLAIACNDLVTTNVTVPVTMTILADDLQITPTGLFSSSGVQGGPFTPSEISYTLTNRGGSSLNWAIIHTQSWVSVSPSSGTLAAGSSLLVTGAINSAANLLGPGSYADTLMFSNRTSGAAQPRAVALQVQPPPPVAICYFSLDTDPGWSTAGQWAFGRPLGGGSHNYDPTAGHTGTNVFGYNLAGDYPDNMPLYYLTTTALDCSGYEHVSLKFWRWLGVESANYDHANIEVSRDGVAWVEVWAHTGGALADTAWQEVSYDISAVADRQSTVYLRWGMGTTDNSVTYPGWNIDDISLTGNSLASLAPVITAQPQSRTNAVGTTATFTVTASGDSPLSYQWCRNAVPLNNGVYVAGATTDTLTLSGISSNDIGSYSVVVINAGGSDTSSNALLTVTAPAETVIPTLTLVKPTAGDYPTSVVEARGTATDKVPGKVARVLTRVISGTTTGAWQTATLGVHKTNLGVVTVNWTNLVTLATGTNLVQVKAQDTSLNDSKTPYPAAKVFFKVPGVLTLVTNGSGSLSVLASLPASPPYYVGRSYILKTKPSLNNLFSNVVANGTVLYSAAPATAAQTGTNVTFTMQTNLMLVGNFDTNRFFVGAGTYHGLFSDATGVAHQSAGYIKLTVTKGLAFSGTMYVAGEAVALSGKFDLAGVGTLTKLVVSRKGMTNEPISVVPVMDFANQQITGVVSNGAWTAEIETDLAVYNLLNSPPAGTLGRYTMRLPSSGLAGEPGGDGYATFNVKRSATSGAVQLATDIDATLTAMLGIPVSGNYFGDQERMTPVAAVPPSKDGRYPFYAKLHKYYRTPIDTPPPVVPNQTTYKGSVVGWLTIGNSNLVGDLVWNKIGWTNGAYDAGFSNSMTVAGSSYVPPALFQKVINLGDNAVVVLQGGGLSEPITCEFDWTLTGTGANKLVWPTAGGLDNPNRISLTINAGTGRIEGTFVPDLNFPTIKASVKSAVLQNGNTAHGNFKVKGGSASGSMLIYQP